MRGTKKRKLLKGCSAAVCRTSIITVLAVTLLAFNFSRRPSPHTRKQRSALSDLDLPGRIDPSELLIAEKKRERVHALRAQFGASENTARDGRSVKDDGKVGASSEGHSEGNKDATSTNQSLPAGYASVHNGVLMPQIGFGTAGLGGGTKQAVAWALQAGYRLIDSAQAREWYREDLVGEALSASTIPRSQLFLVSKLHPRHIGYAITKQRFADSLRDLGTSYLDLFLLHYPWCFQGICGDVQPSGTWKDSWEAMEELYKEKKARAIGVSNFGEDELAALLRVASIKPHVVQRNSDPFNADKAVQAMCRKHGILYMGYSTLGSQWLMRGFSSSPVLDHAAVQSIAKQRACTPAQVVLKWALMNKQVVIPRSSNQSRIAENLKSNECALEQADVDAIDKLDGFDPTSAQ